MTRGNDKVIFQETQQFRQKWLWLILLLVDLVIIGFLIFRMLGQQDTDSLQEYEASSSISWGVIAIFGLVVLFSTGLVYLFYIMKLITEVRDDGLYVKFFPLTRQKRIEFKNIKSCYARSYRPIREYGGWGIRYGQNGKAYNVSGNQGVQLELTQDKSLLIGSQKADELAEAINSKL